MMHPTELRRFPPFATLTSAELTGIAAVARSRTYRHGVRMFRAGDRCADVTLVLDGFVRLSRRPSSGPEVLTGIIRPGGLAALAPLRGAATHDHDAEALGYVRAVEVPAAPVLALVCRSSRLFEELARSLVSQAGEAYVDGAVDARERLPLRVLHTLRRLAREVPVGRDAQSMQPLAVRLSHAEVARLVGSDRASVTRAIRLLGERGLVRRERGHVTGVVLVPHGSAKEVAASFAPGGASAR